MGTTATAPTTRKPRRTRKTSTPLMVCGRGFRKADHALVWMVPSQSEANRWHQVTQSIEGQLSSLVCDCAGWSYRHTCAHRDAVLRTLADEEAVFQAVQSLLTTQERHEREDERASAILRRSQEPVSIWR